MYSRQVAWMSTHPNIRIARGSWADRSDDVLRGCDVIFHVAGYVPSNMSDASEAVRCFEVNALGTLELIGAAVASQVPRLLLFSSGQIYSYSDGLVTETHPTFPSSHAPYYLVSKLAAEIYLEHAHSRGGIKATALRIGSCYGPGMSPKGVVYRFVSNAACGEALTISGGGAATADYIHVRDVVAAAVACVERNVEGPVNIGAGRAVTVSELAQAVCGVFPDRSINVQHTARERNRGFAGLDISRARNLLGYAPMSICDGLRAFRSELGL
jgi:UDP-glucose 4-epimerase